MSLIPVNSEDKMKKGMREFLTQLSSEDLHGLLKTTTGNLIAAESDKEAIDTILTFSDAVTLLNRRRIKREFLARYLVSKKKAFNIQSTSKSNLCNIVLEVWGQNDTDYKFREEKPPPSQSRMGSGDQFEGTEEEEEEESMNFETSPNNDSERYRRHQEFLIGQELGIEFSKWFFNALNTQSDFSSKHFWDDCSLNVEYINEGYGQHYFKNIQANKEESFQNLRDLVIKDRINFNPNILNGLGIRGKINPHGLAQVLVCGTIHRGASPVGTFEQVFGLIKDPTCGGNYKVKFSVLRLREKSLAALSSPGQSYIQPAIEDTNLAGIIEITEEDSN